MHWWKVHQRGEYSAKEVAVTLSHLKAIRTAYEDGHDIALILEDDVQLYDDFASTWKSYVNLAPEDWQILQMLTINEKSVLDYLEGIRHDAFVPYMPEHWSTGAYIINRSGMLAVLTQTVENFDPTPTTKEWDPLQTTFRLMHSHKLTLADEVLYMMVRTYTSVYPYFGNRKSISTVQVNNKGNLENDFHKGSQGAIERIRKNRTSRAYLYPPKPTFQLLTTTVLPGIRKHKDEEEVVPLLILTVGRTSSSAQISTRITMFCQNVHFLKKVFGRDVWLHFYVITTTTSLLSEFQRKWNAQCRHDQWKRSSVVLSLDVLPQQFNKFRLFAQLLKDATTDSYTNSNDENNDNDDNTHIKKSPLPPPTITRSFQRIMFVDDDIELLGFPWREFVKRTIQSKSLITGPLRQSLLENTALSRHTTTLHTDFPMQNGRWWKKKEAPGLTTDFQFNTLPTDFLEMFMFMMEGRFAMWFFSHITPLVDDGRLIRDWGPDQIWCGAAQSYMQMHDDIALPCSLIPLLASDQNAMSINEASKGMKISRYQSGEYASAKYKKAFPLWYDYSYNFREKWTRKGRNVLVKGTSSKMRNDPFTFASCRKCDGGYCVCKWAKTKTCGKDDGTCCFECCCSESALWS